MLLEAIYHRPKDNYAYACTNEEIYIQIRTKKNDIDKVTLLNGDPYQWEDGKWIYNNINMVLTGSDHLFDYWSVRLSPPFKRLRYGFLLQDEDRRSFMEKGLCRCPFQIQESISVFHF